MVVVLNVVEVVIVIIVLGLQCFCGQSSELGDFTHLLTM